MQALFSMLALGTAAGCKSQPPVVEVEGVVQLAGKPLPQVRVQFMPDPEKGTVGPISVGTTDEQGRFKLVCADQRPGAVVGWHRVVITDMRTRLPRTARHGRRDDDEKQPNPKPTSLSSRVPDRYTTSGHTPLSVEVKPPKQEVTLDLSAPGRPV
jgi:hypothetical protein